MRSRLWRRKISGRAAKTRGKRKGVDNPMRKKRIASSGEAAAIRRDRTPVRGGAVGRFFRRLLRVKQTRSLTGDLLNLLVLAMFSVIMIIPMLYVINNSLKPLSELFLYPPRFFVENPTFDNFLELGSLMSNTWVPMSRYLFNTVFVTAAGSGLHVIFSSMAAYVLEKHRFHGRNLFFSVVVLTLMFSPTVTAIPNFIILSNLHLVDTYTSLIWPAIGSSLGLFLMKQFMGSVHDSILEAAKIDGAGELRIFFRVVMPSVKPAWMTLIIFSVQSLWNANGGVSIHSEQLKPLTYALGQIAAGGVRRAGASAAVSVVMMIVPITIFIITQSNILDTMTASGIKE